MQVVEVKCNVALDDATAEWLKDMMASESFPSDLAYYFMQKRNGGYVLTHSELDTIVTDIVESIEVDTDTLSDTTSIEDAMKRAMMEMISEGVFNIGGMQGGTITTAIENNKVTVTKKTEEEEVVSNIVLFEEPDTSSDSEDMSEEDADDLADDLADFFGF